MLAFPKGNSAALPLPIVVPVIEPHGSNAAITLTLVGTALFLLVHSERQIDERRACAPQRQQRLCEKRLALN
jgi:hypothetical protein